MLLKRRIFRLDPTIFESKEHVYQRKASAHRFVSFQRGMPVERALFRRALSDDCVASILMLRLRLIVVRPSAFVRREREQDL